MSYVTAIDVELSRVVIKFEKTVKISSLTIDHVLLYEGMDVDPIPDAFDPIVIADDYNTISRTLYLPYTTALQPSTSYRLKLTGLLDPLGTVYPDYEVTFTTPASIITFTPATPDQVPIIDESIQLDPFTLDDNTVGTVVNPEFFITETDPENDDIYVDEDHNNGRMTITFSDTPNASFAVPTYFKVQRKKVQRAPGRWETLTAEVSTSGNQIFIDFPSDDATPVYNTAGHTYFVQGYKYRVRVSKDIGT